MQGLALTAGSYHSSESSCPLVGLLIDADVTFCDSCIPLMKRDSAYCVDVNFNSHVLIKILVSTGLTLGYCSPPWCHIGNPLLKIYDPVKNSVDLINTFLRNLKIGQKTPLDM